LTVGAKKDYDSEDENELGGMSQAVMDVCERVNVNGYDFGRAQESDEKEPSEDDEPRLPNRVIEVNDLYPGVAVIEESPPPVTMKSCLQPQKHVAAFMGKVSTNSVSAAGTGASARNLKGSKVAKSRNFQLCGKSMDSIRRGDAGKSTISAKDFYIPRKKSG
jgi:hypothetical protein